MNTAKLGTDLRYPLNLYYDIFGGEHYTKYIHDRNDLELIRDVMLSINNHKWKTENKLKAFRILEYRYSDKMSFHEIADIFRVSTERIRQIVVMTLRICRSPNGYCIKGISGNITLEHKNLKDDYNRIVESVKAIQNIASSGVNSGFSTPIGALDLTIRTYNCLRRSGIETLLDLKELSLNDLIKIRNLGKKSLKEVLDVCRTYGIIFE